jgi:hypothetical protein
MLFKEVAETLSLGGGAISEDFSIFSCFLVFCSGFIFFSL